MRTKPMFHRTLVATGSLAVGLAVAGTPTFAQLRTTHPATPQGGAYWEPPASSRSEVSQAERPSRPATDGQTIDTLPDAPLPQPADRPSGERQSSPPPSTAQQPPARPYANRLGVLPGTVPPSGSLLGYRGIPTGSFGQGSGSPPPWGEVGTYPGAGYAPYGSYGGYAPPAAGYAPGPYREHAWFGGGTNYNLWSNQPPLWYHPPMFSQSPIFYFGSAPVTSLDVQLRQQLERLEQQSSGR